MRMVSDTASEILATYDLQRSRLEEFRATCQQLLKALIKADGLNVHSVNSRVKGRDSLSEKLALRGEQYTSLSDVTDVVGLRVITYFNDEVDRIGSLIEQEMEVDSARSIDKRKALDPDRFGYLSLHYICSLNQDRLRLAEHKHYVGLVCEIQVRTILQHAWAEIEHDLGYKAGGEVALPLRRRFSQLAGLLELADGEFARLRDDLRQYTEEVRQKIEVQPTEVKIDEVSLGQFLSSDSFSRALDKEMAEFIEANLTTTSDLQRLAAQLRFVGVETIDQLKKALGQFKDVILDQWRIRLSGNRHETLQQGISTFHLFQVLAVEQGGVAKLGKAFALFHIAGKSKVVASAAAQIKTALGRHPGSK